MIELRFNPYSTTSGLKVMFEKHPVVAKFYLLWRSTHLTSQVFPKRCKLLMRDINPAFQYDIHQFVNLLRDHNLCSPDEFMRSSCSRVDTAWVMSHWDYFNPNIRKSLEFKYKYRSTKKTSVIT